MFAKEKTTHLILCLIEDTSHLVLLEEIHGFIRCARPGCYSKKLLIKKRIVT